MIFNKLITQINIGRKKMIIFQILENFRTIIKTFLKKSYLPKYPFFYFF